MADGAWIFLSHSHKDFDRVRDLRNELETLGHHPLMFFLKCLGDDSEIDDLIRREIAARSWFVLCDSDNAIASRWVQQEREIIRNLPEHNSASVVLDDPLLTQLDSLSTLTRQASVFFSYARTDQAIALRMATTLRNHDFGVFLDIQSLSPGSRWQVEIERALDDAATRGAVLVLLSASAVRSESQRREIDYALTLSDPSRRQTHILPIFLEPPASLLGSVPRPLAGIQGIDFSVGDFDENMRLVMRALRRYDWGQNKPSS